MNNNYNKLISWVLAGSLLLSSATPLAAQSVETVSSNVPTYTEVQSNYARKLQELEQKETNSDQKKNLAALRRAIKKNLTLAGPLYNGGQTYLFGKMQTENSPHYFVLQFKARQRDQESIAPTENMLRMPAYSPQALSQSAIPHSVVQSLASFILPSANGTPVFLPPPLAKRTYEKSRFKTSATQGELAAVLPEDWQVTVENNEAHFSPNAAVHARIASLTQPTQKKDASNFWRRTVERWKKLLSIFTLHGREHTTDTSFKNSLYNGILPEEEYPNTYKILDKIVGKLWAVSEMKTPTPKVVVLDIDTINAFIMPSRPDRVYVHLGLLKAISAYRQGNITEEDIAYVLGHEIGHLLQHSHEESDQKKDRELSREEWLANTRAREYDADLKSLTLMDQAGYSVKLAHEFFTITRGSDQSFFQKKRKEIAALEKLKEQLASIQKAALDRKYAGQEIKEKRILFSEEDAPLFDTEKMKTILSNDANFYYIALMYKISTRNFHPVEPFNTTAPLEEAALFCRKNFTGIQLAIDEQIKNLTLHFESSGDFDVNPTPWLPQSMLDEKKATAGMFWRGNKTYDLVLSNLHSTVTPEDIAAIENNIRQDPRLKEQDKIYHVDEVRKIYKRLSAPSQSPFESTHPIDGERVSDMDKLIHNSFFVNFHKQPRSFPEDVKVEWQQLTPSKKTTQILTGQSSSLDKAGYIKNNLDPQDIIFFLSKTREEERSSELFNAAEKRIHELSKNGDFDVLLYQLRCLFNKPNPQEDLKTLSDAAGILEYMPIFPTKWEDNPENPEQGLYNYRLQKFAREHNARVEKILGDLLATHPNPESHLLLLIRKIKFLQKYRIFEGGQETIWMGFVDLTLKHLAQQDTPIEFDLLKELIKFNSGWNASNFPHFNALIRKQFECNDNLIVWLEKLKALDLIPKDLKDRQEEKAFQAFGNDYRNAMDNIELLKKIDQYRPWLKIIFQKYRALEEKSNWEVFRFNFIKDAIEKNLSQYTDIAYLAAPPAEDTKETPFEFHSIFKGIEFLALNDDKLPTSWLRIVWKDDNGNRHDRIGRMQGVQFISDTGANDMIRYEDTENIYQFPDHSLADQPYYQLLRENLSVQYGEVEIKNLSPQGLSLLFVYSQGDTSKDIWKQLPPGEAEQIYRLMTKKLPPAAREKIDRRYQETSYFTNPITEKPFKLKTDYNRHWLEIFADDLFNKSNDDPNLYNPFLGEYSFYTGRADVSLYSRDSIFRKQLPLLRTNFSGDMSQFPFNKLEDYFDASIAPIKGKSWEETINALNTYMPRSLLRNYFLYYLFYQRIIKPKLGNATPDLFDYNAIGQRFQENKSLKTPEVFKAYLKIAPLITEDIYLAKINALRSVSFPRLHQYNPNVLTDQQKKLYEENKAHFENYADQEIGTRQNSIDLLLAQWLKPNARAYILDEKAFSDQFKRVQEIFPRSSRTRDFWIDQILPDQGAGLSVSELEEVFNLMVSPDYKNKVGLWLLEKRSSESDSFSYQIYWLKQYFPYRSRFRDDILANIERNKVSSGKEQKIINALKLRHESTVTEQEVSTNKEVEDNMLIILQNMNPTEKQKMLLWLMRLSDEKPDAVKMMELSNYSHFDYLRDEEILGTTHYKNIGESQKRALLEQLLLHGKNSIIEEDKTLEFLDQLWLGLQTKYGVKNSPQIFRILKLVFQNLSKDKPRQFKILSDVILEMEKLDKAPEFKGNRPELSELRLARISKVFLQSIGVVGIKLGQYLSASEQMKLSATSRKVLGQLTEQAGGLDKNMIFSILKALGEPDALLSNLLGAASIKTVFRRKDRPELVYKFKNLQVYYQAQKDLGLLKAVIADLLTEEKELKPEEISITPRQGEDLIGELENIVEREQNFELEMKNTQTLADNESKRQLGSSFYATHIRPKLIESLGKKEDLQNYPFSFEVVHSVHQNMLIKAKYIDGVSLRKYQGKDKELIRGLVLLKLLDQLMIDGVVHNDAHEGNVFIVKKPGQTQTEIVFLDAGDIRQIDKQTSSQVLSVLVYGYLDKSGVKGWILKRFLEKKLPRVTLNALPFEWQQFLNKHSYLWRAASEEEKKSAQTGHMDWLPSDVDSLATENSIAEKVFDFFAKSDRDLAPEESAVWLSYFFHHGSRLGNRFVLWRMITEIFYSVKNRLQARSWVEWLHKEYNRLAKEGLPIANILSRLSPNLMIAGIHADGMDANLEKEVLKKINKKYGIEIFTVDNTGTVFFGPRIAPVAGTQQLGIALTPGQMASIVGVHSSLIEANRLEQSLETCFTMIQSIHGVVGPVDWIKDLASHPSQSIRSAQQIVLSLLWLATQEIEPQQNRSRKENSIDTLSTPEQSGKEIDLLLIRPITPNTSQKAIQTIAHAA